MNVLVLGGTGGIGRVFVARLLAARPDARITAWARATSVGKLADLADPRLLVRAVDVERPAPEDWPEPLDAVVNCMGSNYAHGSNAEFWRIDCEVPLALAREARRRGCPTFVLLSALGAHRRHPMVFLRTKGVLAHELGGLGFPRLRVLLPPFVTDSTVPRPWYERGLLNVNVALSPLLIGPLGGLRPITCADVADQLIGALG